MSTEITARISQVSATTSMAAARQHACMVDRPASKGGADRGPMGGELLLMGVGGCFMSNLLAAAAARQLELAETAVDVTATLDGTPPRFTAIALTVTGGGTDHATMRELIELAEASCISVNTIKAQVAVKVALA